MSRAPGSSLPAWGVLLSALLVACQPVRPVPTPTPTPTPTANGLAPSGVTQEARVTDIVDGDTIRVEIGGQEFRVRYIGIDAPEMSRDNYGGEPLSVEATQANADLVEGSIVILEKDVSDTDQFGRLLRYVWVGGSESWQLVNQELAAMGLADVKAYPPDTARQRELQAAEDAAKAADLGIWAN